MSTRTRQFTSPLSARIERLQEALKAALLANELARYQQKVDSDIEALISAVEAAPPILDTPALRALMPVAADASPPVRKVAHARKASTPAEASPRRVGPSRGRKHCAGCDSYVGVRTMVCKCGHNFYSSPAEPSISVPANSMDAEPSVERVVADPGVPEEPPIPAEDLADDDPVTLPAPTVEPPPPPTPVATAQPDRPIDENTWMLKTVMHPTEKCPVELNGDLKAWASAVRADGLRRGLKYTVTALRDFLKTLMDQSTPEYETASAELAKI